MISFNNSKPTPKFSKYLLYKENFSNFKVLIINNQTTHKCRSVLYRYCADFLVVFLV